MMCRLFDDVRGWFEDGLKMVLACLKDGMEIV